MKPCSPANFSFNERRSIGLSLKESGAGLKANQPASLLVAATLAASPGLRMPFG